MKTIILGKTGKSTKVDDADFESLTQHEWSFEGRYAHRMVRGRKIYLHSVLMNHVDGNTVDHINQDKLDNQRNNLRVVSYAANLRNRTYPNKSSGLKGVTWSKRDKRWKAQITIDYKNVHLGYFPTKEEAHSAYLTRIKTLEPYA